jgi:DNA-binding transcriptional ArsR family regulator
VTRSRGPAFDGGSPAKSGQRAADIAPVFAALGDETRLRIVTRLCGAGPQSIVRLTEGSRITRQAVTKHLRALSSAGLVRSARSRYLDLISAQWDEAIGRLKAFVERPTPKP